MRCCCACGVWSRCDSVIVTPVPIKRCGVLLRSCSGGGKWCVCFTCVCAHFCSVVIAQQGCSSACLQMVGIAGCGGLQVCHNLVRRVRMFCQHGAAAVVVHRTADYCFYTMQNWSPSLRLKQRALRYALLCTTHCAFLYRSIVMWSAIT
jgi:hypothetical protein